MVPFWLLHILEVFPLSRNNVQARFAVVGILMPPILSVVLSGFNQ